MLQPQITKGQHSISQFLYDIDLVLMKKMLQSSQSTFPLHGKIKKTTNDLNKDRVLQITRIYIRKVTAKNNKNQDRLNEIKIQLYGALEYILEVIAKKIEIEQDQFKQA